MIHAVQVTIITYSDKSPVVNLPLDIPTSQEHKQENREASEFIINECSHYNRIIYSHCECGKEVEKEDKILLVHCQSELAGAVEVGEVDH